MTDTIHQVHGLAGDDTEPDWPALTDDDVAQLLRHYPQQGQPLRIEWRSPRPLSAAAVVGVGNARMFVKRHHVSVRSVDTLMEEHRFMAHLRDAGLPLVNVLRNLSGDTATLLGDWVCEVHSVAAGIDLYREAMSWSPLPNRHHAFAAGDMLAAMHDAAAGYDAPQRTTHILVARTELITAADPLHALRTQLPQRPGLAAYLDQRDWQADVGALLAPWHARVQPRLAQQPRLWTHGDWHVSNLCWSNASDTAQISAVLDFGLCAANFALFDLATAIERNAIAWLALEGPDPAHIDIAHALIEGYRRRRHLSREDVHLLADLLPLVHVDFALSEVEYFHAITHSRASADVAYDTFLRGHAAWFGTPAGEALLKSIRDMA
jgi:Ser/Thr protein kinase RdoA (MazF antagonist)